MRCERCEQDERTPVKHAKLAERHGQVAVILDVPMEECQACGDRWFRWEVAGRLDELLAPILATGAEFATAHFTEAQNTSPNIDTSL